MTASSTPPRRRFRLPRPRLLPVVTGAMALLFLAKAEALWRQAAPVAGTAPPPAAEARAPAAAPRAWAGVVAPARAADPEPAPPRGSAATSHPRAPAPAEAPPPPDPQLQAERAVLESLRARRAELEAREQAAAAREVVLEAAERRLTARVEELTALQRRLEALERGRSEREEQGWRGLVKLYETMRPRDAATIFDEMEMPVLVQIVDRMGERKAAPVIGAMRPERARALTAELARVRGQRSAAE